MLALVLISGFVVVFFVYKNTKQDVGNLVYTLESPQPNTVVMDNFLIKGISKHTLDNLVFFTIYDRNYKNNRGTELGLNGGSIWIKNFDKSGYGSFEMRLQSVYPESSGEVILELYTYDPGDTKYSTKTNIMKIPLRLKRDQ